MTLAIISFSSLFLACSKYTYSWALIFLFKTFYSEFLALESFIINLYWAQCENISSELVIISNYNIFLRTMRNISMMMMLTANHRTIFAQCAKILKSLIPQNIQWLWSIYGEIMSRGYAHAILLFFRIVRKKSLSRLPIPDRDVVRATRRAR